ncbi:MAG: VOC family protein [Colwellia sp.]|nr:VOC family protein [Colwellia sp.]
MVLKPISCLVILFSLLLPSHFINAEVNNEQQAELLEQKVQGQLIWADLYSADVKASIDFYTNTFDWTVKKLGEPSSSYHIFYQNGSPVAGLLDRSAKRDKTNKALWIGSIYTPNVAQVINESETKGATIILKPHEFDFFGNRAVMADPLGGIIALLDLESSNKKRRKDVDNHWGWAQLFSIDTQAASAFYAEAFDYQIEDIKGRDKAYYLSKNDNVYASVIKMPEKFPQRDRWVNFFEIVDVEKHLAKAIENGAKVIYSSPEQQLAIIADPSGAFIGLTELPAPLAMGTK